MPKGSLDEWLYNNVLTRELRYDILAGVAAAGTLACSACLTRSFPRNRSNPSLPRQTKTLSKTYATKPQKQQRTRGRKSNPTPSSAEHEPSPILSMGGEQTGSGCECSRGFNSTGCQTSCVLHYAQTQADKERRSLWLSILFQVSTRTLYFTLHSLRLLHYICTI
jgi:hypothetical protein